MCEKCYNPIAVQPYIANCISRLPRLTLLDLQIELMNMLSEQRTYCIHFLLSTWQNLKSSQILFGCLDTPWSLWYVSHYSINAFVSVNSSQGPLRGNVNVAHIWTT